MDHNTDLRHAKDVLLALKASHTSAEPFFPSAPMLSASAARRRNSDPLQAWNWYVTLSQEVDISGQRNARLDSIDAQMAAQVRRIATHEQETQAMALTLYVAMGAAYQRMQLAEETKTLAHTVLNLAQTHMEASLISQLDFDIAYADALHLASTYADAVIVYNEAQNTLKTFLGVSNNIPMDANIAKHIFSSLTWAIPNLEDLLKRALLMRGEIAAAEEERKASLLKKRWFQRTRIPRITFSVTAQNDGFNERVLGAGLSIPLPTPNKVAPYASGDIAKENIQTQQWDKDIKDLQKKVQNEVMEAYEAVRIQHSKWVSFNQDHAERMHKNIYTLKEAVQTKHLSLREALTMQHILLDFLISYNDTRTALIASHIHLARVASLPFAGIFP